jgi:hypothetical protein
MCRRHVHASDIVPRVPANLGYTHHGKLRYIPSFDISDTVRSALLPTSRHISSLLSAALALTAAAATQGHARAIVLLDRFQQQAPAASMSTVAETRSLPNWMESP